MASKDGITHTEVLGNLPNSNLEVLKKYICIALVLSYSLGKETEKKGGKCYSESLVQALHGKVKLGKKAVTP